MSLRPDGALKSSFLNEKQSIKCEEILRSSRRQAEICLAAGAFKPIDFKFTPTPSGEDAPYDTPSLWRTKRKSWHILRNGRWTTGSFKHNGISSC